MNEHASQTSFTLVQSGSGLGLGFLPNFWQDISLPIGITTTALFDNCLGLVFNHTTYPASTTDTEQTARLFGDHEHLFTLTIVAGSVAVNPFIEHVLYFYSEPVTPLWATNASPHNANIAGNLRMIQLIEAGNWVNSGGTYTLTVAFDPGEKYRVPTTFGGLGVQPTFAAGPGSSLLSVINGTSWSGRLAFAIIRNPSIAAGVGDTFNITSVSLTGYALDWWTGEAGGRANTNRRERVVLDSRYGMPSYAGDLVEDDYRPGNWVRRHDWDPEDPESDYTGSPSEGETDDKPVR